MCRFHCYTKSIKIKIHRTIVWTVVLCGCEAWSLTLREEHSLRLLERRELEEICGLKWDDVTGKWRDRMNREDLCALYTLPIIRLIKSRKNQGHVERMGYRRRTYRVLIDRFERRPTQNCMITITWIFKKWDGKESSGLIWLRIGTIGRRL